MSAQYHGSSADGVRTYIDRNGDTVQESSGPVPIFRGLAAAGGEAFISDSEEDSAEEYHSHSHSHIPKAEKKHKKEKKEKKEKKSKKDRSGSSSSGHACTCSHSH